MEESMMYNPGNPFPEEMIRTQPSEAYPPMEELPRKPPPQSPTVQPPPPPATQPQQAEPLEVGESPVTGREEALTIKFAIGKLNDYLLWFLMVLEVTLLIEFFLMLIGAQPNNLFAGFMSTKLGTSGAEIEWSTLIAMAVYFLVFYALRRFLSILISGPEEPVE